MQVFSLFLPAFPLISVLYWTVFPDTLVLPTPYILLYYFSVSRRSLTTPVLGSYSSIRLCLGQRTVPCPSPCPSTTETNASFFWIKDKRRSLNWLDKSYTSTSTAPLVHKSVSENEKEVNKFSLAGVDAVTADKDALLKAHQMTYQGSSEIEIFSWTMHHFWRVIQLRIWWFW